VLTERIRSRKADASDATVAVLKQAASHDDGGGSWNRVDATDFGRARDAIKGMVGIRGDSATCRGADQE
jgi:predicted kinase